jgi:hypothetical protein
MELELVSNVNIPINAELELVAAEEYASFLHLMIANPHE